MRPRCRETLFAGTLQTDSSVNGCNFISLYGVILREIETIVGKVNKTIPSDYAIEYKMAAFTES